MSRINAGIPPNLLSNRHLIAEHREIIRVVGYLKKNGIPHPIRIPKQFTLGKGHLLFFTNKGRYLKRRYEAIYEECLERKFKVQDYSAVWDYFKDYPELDKEFSPGFGDRLITIDRLIDRDTMYYNNRFKLLLQQYSKEIELKTQLSL